MRIDRPLKMFSILSRRFAWRKYKFVPVPEICTNTCQEQLPKLLLLLPRCITIIAIFMNSPRNYVSYNPPPPSFSPSRIYSSISSLLIIPMERFIRLKPAVSYCNSSWSNCNSIHVQTFLTKNFCPSKCQMSLIASLLYPVYWYIII